MKYNLRKIDKSELIDILNIDCNGNYTLQFNINDIEKNNIKLTAFRILHFTDSIIFYYDTIENDSIISNSFRFTEFYKLQFSLQSKLFNYIIFIDNLFIFMMDDNLDVVFKLFDSIEYINLLLSHYNNNILTTIEYDILQLDYNCLTIRREYNKLVACDKIKHLNNIHLDILFRDKIKLQNDNLFKNKINMNATYLDILFIME